MFSDWRCFGVMSFDQAQELSFERGVFMISIFVEMPGDWVATGYGRFDRISHRCSFHLCINSLPVSPIYCLLHCRQVRIYTKLLDWQLMLFGPLAVQPVVVLTITLFLRNCRHHTQFSFVHLLLRFLGVCPYGFHKVGTDEVILEVSVSPICYDWQFWK